MQELIESNTLEFAPNVTIKVESVNKAMKFMIKREEFIEKLEAGERSAAVIILRKHLAPLCTSESQQADLHQLSKLLVLPRDEMMKIEMRQGIMSGSRDAFLLKLLSI